MSAAPPPESPNRQHGNVLAISVFVVVCCCLAWGVWDRWDAMGPINHPLPAGGRGTPAPEAATNMPAAVRLPPAPQPVQEADEPPPLPPPALVLQSGKLSWELQIDAVLVSPIPEQEKAAWLLSQLRSMPPEAFSRLAQEAADRLPDRYYASVALPLLLDPNTHGTVESVLFTDLIERPDSITLPALLSLARIHAHPFAASARESLALLLGTDFGSDWARWEQAVAQALLEAPQR